MEETLASPKMAEIDLINIYKGYVLGHLKGFLNWNV